MTSNGSYTDWVSFRLPSLKAREGSQEVLAVGKGLVDIGIGVDEDSRLSSHRLALWAKMSWHNIKIRYFRNAIIIEQQHLQQSFGL